MIRAYPVANKQKSVDICNAFIAGAPKKTNGAVFYGVTENNVQMWHVETTIGDPFNVYYIDNSYFDCVRGQQYRVTRGRVQKFVGPKDSSDGKRFDALGLTIKPWKPFANQRWLVVEQSESFMRYVANSPFWLEEQARGLPFGQMSEMRVRRWERDKLRHQTTLATDLEWADNLLTHSSAAAVEAVMVGVPVIVSRMSALADMVCSADPKLDERHRYLGVLADNQWTLDEIREGKAWAHLQKS